MNWIDVKEQQIPENKNVLAYNEDWIDYDTNPEGIRIGFMFENIFYSPEFNNDYDSYDNTCGDYETDYSMPTHWMPLTEIVTLTQKL